MHWTDWIRTLPSVVKSHTLGKMLHRLYYFATHVRVVGGHWFFFHNARNIGNFRDFLTDLAFWHENCYNRTNYINCRRERQKGNNNDFYQENRCLSA